MSKLLVIESPGKLSKLKSILGAGWTVKASIGHVRELADEGEDNLGFELTGSRVNCHYVPRDSRSKKVLSELRAAVKTSSQVYLATDPDREGETISWHLADELKLKNPLRVTYTEITPAAVKQAIAHPRPLDQNLVAAGRARDCLDKLVGYRGSPLVWPLGAKSVGRVQSATLRLICLREQEIETFVPETYYSVWVEYAEGFKAFYKRSLESKRSKPSSEDDSIDDTAKSTDKTTPESDRVKDKAEAEQLVAIARSHPHHIIKVERKTASIKPPAPFTTSTLQQAAGSRLSLNPERTMQLAQQLYEQGHITYMRTDSVVLSEEFCTAVEHYLKQHDPDNVPKRVAKHRGSKNAQEAHEAIRPTHVEQTPSQLAHQLGAPEAKLYEMIWNRTVASLCAPAIVEKTKVITQSGSAYWQALGQVVKFPGYTIYWNNLSADKELPVLSEEQKLTLKDAGADEKQTTPPPRYTEPKLVQKMERLGIGRPSTYSPTIKTLKAREYVQLTKGKLSPTQLGRDVNAFLEKALPDLVDAQFTAGMEEQLDAIASGKQNWEAYLNNWNRDYFAPALTKAKGLVQTSAARLPKTPASRVESSGINCPNCGKQLVKVPSAKCTGGHFLSCDRRNGGCGTVMFLNRNSQQYELPMNKPQSGIKANRNQSRKKAQSATTPRRGNRKNNKVTQSQKKIGEQDFKVPIPVGEGCRVRADKVDMLPKIDSAAVQHPQPSSAQKATVESSGVNCPSCSAMMVKVPSAKCTGGHFLSCDQRKGGCGTVMFLNRYTQQYELPRSKPQSPPVALNQELSKLPSQPIASNQLTESVCPVCGSPLERHGYVSKGESKTMLRCSHAKNRSSSCKDVVYWPSRGLFWSPTYGELKV